MCLNLFELVHNVSILPSGVNSWIAIPKSSFNKFTHRSLTTAQQQYISFSLCVSACPCFLFKEEAFESCTIPPKVTVTVNSLRLLRFPSCMECHLSTILAPCAVALPRCGAADVRVLGTVQQNTSTALVCFICK